MSRTFQEAYQRRFVEEQLPAAWKAGHKSVLLVLPVSAGKTRCARLVIERLLRLGDWDVWFGAHRRELVEQSAAELAHLEPRVLLAGTPTPSPCPLRVFSRDTLSRREIVPLRDKCFLVVDEAHKILGNQWLSLIAKFRAVYRVVYVLMLTATPYRLDGKPLANVADALIEPVTPGELIDNDVIHEPRLIYYEEIGGLDKVHKVGGDFAASELELLTKKLDGDVVKEFKKWCDGYPGVLRAATVAHSKSLVERMRAAGFRAEHLDGETPLAQRDEIFARLAVGGERNGCPAGVDVLCQVDVASEGWNPPSDYDRYLRLEHLHGSRIYPYAPICILSDCRPTLSSCGYMQFLGRGCRQSGDTVPTSQGPMPALPKPWFRYLDHSRNWERHGKLREHWGFSLTDGEPKGRPPRDKRGLISARYCPKCLSVWPISAGICPCGAQLTQARVLEETTERQLSAAEPKLAAASDTRKADLLANLWAREVRARGTIEAVNYKRVAAIYKGMTGSWPSSEAISAAKKAALDKLGRRGPDSS